MKDYLKKIKKCFLNPEESNFNLLLEKITFLHKQVLRRIDNKNTRINFKPDFLYSDEIIKEESPLEETLNNSVLEEVSEAFEGMIRWHEPNTLHNVTPSPLLNTVAASTLVNLYNPNLLMDYTSGKLILFEKRVIKTLCSLVGWDYKAAEGMSIFGGKASFMYAIKIGLNKIDRKVVSEGLNDKYVVLTSSANHYTIESVCNILGLGTSNCVRVPCDEKDEIIPEEFELTFRNIIKNGQKLACIVLSGGGTLHHNIDPISQIVKIRNKLVKECKLNYVPHIHVDSLNGWVWLFYNGYDFSKNTLDLNRQISSIVKRASKQIRDIKLADSFAVDFHKTGLSPYISSFFIVKNSEEIYSFNTPEGEIFFDNQYGTVHAQKYMIEHSRSGIGIISSWVALHTLGIRGFQKYLAYMLDVGLYMRDRLQKDFSDNFEIINNITNWHTLLIKPNFKELKCNFEDLLSAKKEDVNLYNDYCFKFYNFIAFEKFKSKKIYPLLGFLPKYWKSTDIAQRAAFIIYPMSPHINHKVCDEILNNLLNLKIEFDSMWSHSYNMKRELKPHHLPR